MAMSPGMVSGRVVTTSMNSPGRVGELVAHAIELRPLTGFMITSSSDRAVSETGHQLTMRLPR